MPARASPHVHSFQPVTRLRDSVAPADLGLTRSRARALGALARVRSGQVVTPRERPPRDPVPAGVAAHGASVWCAAGDRRVTAVGAPKLALPRDGSGGGFASLGRGWGGGQCHPLLSPSSEATLEDTSFYSKYLSKRWPGQSRQLPTDSPQAPVVNASRERARDPPSPGTYARSPDGRRSTKRWVGRDRPSGSSASLASRYVR